MSVNYQLIALNLRIALLQSKVSHQTACVIARIYGKVEPADKCTCRAAEHNEHIDDALAAAHDAGLDSELTVEEA